MKLYSIWDSKVMAFQPPIMQHNDQSAIREIRMMQEMNPDNVMTKYAEDFALWYLCDYDQETGVVSGYENKHVICNLMQIRDGIS